jgi:hypothetical protein
MDIFVHFLVVIITVTLMITSIDASAQPDTSCNCCIGSSCEPTDPRTCAEIGGECRPGGGGGGGCLIVTAAFGSELAPQVQFLKEFRDQRILTTSSGLSFMNVFNNFYYSFSPTVAEYEREHAWLQNTFKVALYPLLNILQIAEKSYSFIPGEYGSMSAGLVASSLIGAVYFSPIVLSIKKVRRNTISPKVAVLTILALTVGVLVALFSNFTIALMVTTSGLVISTVVFSALYSANSIARVAARIPKMARRP